MIERIEIESGKKKSELGSDESEDGS